MDIKYNVYYSTFPKGPWTLANPTPLDHDPAGNEYTISGLKLGATYYFVVVGGYIEDEEFIPLVTQHIGPDGQGARGVASAPIAPLIIREHVVTRVEEGEGLRHQFEGKI